MQGKPDCGKPSGRGLMGSSSSSGSGAPGVKSGPSAGASPGAGRPGAGSALPSGAHHQQQQPASEGGQVLLHAGAAAAGDGAQLPGQVAFSSLQSGGLSRWALRAGHGRRGHAAVDGSTSGHGIANQRTILLCVLGLCFAVLASLECRLSKACWRHSYCIS